MIENQKAVAMAVAVTINRIPDQDDLISWDSWPGIPMPGKGRIQAYISQSLILSVEEKKANNS